MGQQPQAPLLALLLGSAGLIRVQMSDASLTGRNRRDHVPLLVTNVMYMRTGPWRSPTAAKARRQQAAVAPCTPAVSSTLCRRHVLTL